MIAEGVETARQLVQLRELGCQFAQGYYFSRPLTADAASAMLEAPPDWLERVNFEEPEIASTAGGMF